MFPWMSTTTQFLNPVKQQQQKNWQKVETQYACTNVLIVLMIHTTTFDLHLV